MSKTKIHPNKKSLVWSGTAKSLKAILNAQRWGLKMEQLRRRQARKEKETLADYLTRVY